MRFGTSVARTIAVGGAALTLAATSVACQPGASTQELLWCGENQDEVGRAAIELRLIDDHTNFTTWKEDSPNEYERACIEAFNAG